MAISVARANAHVTQWAERLNRFPTTRGWATALFHACQIEVAAQIISDKRIICRNDVNAIICDVANQGALWNNPAAHNYVRLYFRPRNRFHLKTEGIKSLSDPYRVNPHMAIPVMFVFDLASVLSSPNSSFVAGNFASAASHPEQGDASFDLLRFEYIYHDSAPSSEMMDVIQDARMAEVVVLGELPLQHLKAVVCRTIYEEQMLRYMLRDINLDGITIISERSGGLFFRRGIFLSELYVSDGYIHFRFGSPLRNAKSHYKVVVACNDGQPYEFSLAAQSWRVAQIVNHDPAAVWSIYIEDCLAFRGPVQNSSKAIV